MGDAASDRHLPGQADAHLLQEAWGQREGAAGDQALAAWMAEPALTPET